MYIVLTTSCLIFTPYFAQETLTLSVLLKPGSTGQLSIMKCCHHVILYNYYRKDREGWKGRVLFALSDKIPSHQIGFNSTLEMIYTYRTPNFTSYSPLMHLHSSTLLRHNFIRSPPDSTSLPQLPVILVGDFNLPDIQLAHPNS